MDIKFKSTEQGQYTSNNFMIIGEILRNSPLNNIIVGLLRSSYDDNFSNPLSDFCKFC